MGDLVMAIKNRKKRITARISALLLSAAMLCSLSACSDPVAVTKIKGTPTEAGAAESTRLHSVGDKTNLQQVGKSGLIELLFDESTYSVCVADLSHDDSEKLWSALPTQENSGAATATLEIVSGDTLYKLNTQDNSVSSVSYTHLDLYKRQPQGSVGIGHTRWATHGAPTDANAHPHSGSSGRVTLVHNGIIENYLELKAELEKQGRQFKSQTETEVLAQLFDSLYDGNPLETMLKVIKRVRGSYAVAVLMSDHPDEILAAKKDSPLIVGIGSGENYLASDIPALLKYCLLYTSRCV